MKNALKNYISKATALYLTGLLIMSSCGTKPQDDVLVKVNDDVLYTSDIKNIVPPNTASKDSAEIINNFIQDWIQKKALLNIARQNLENIETRFSKQIEDYKNSLIIYTYEEKLINQKLDTAVSDEQITKYYEKHKEDFLLKENIVKVSYLKLPIETKSKELYTIKNLLQKNDKEKLAEISREKAVNSYLDDESWLFFYDLLKEIPIQTYNQENYLRNNRYIEISDSLYIYMLNIKDFKIRESVSPLSFERDNIRNIIINKRKIKLINKIHEYIYKDALQKSNIIINN